jgi:hypothetical protein
LEKKDIIRKDRSGVSTILAVAVIVILVVAGAAAYIVLSGGEKGEGRETIAPGTVLEYKFYANGDESGAMECTYLGQNADDYFVMWNTLKDGISKGKEYDILPKNAPKDANVTTTNLETIEGTITMEIWEYSSWIGKESIQVKAYVNPSNGLMYKEERTLYGNTNTKVLEEYEPLWQKGYRESNSIGLTFEYNPRQPRTILTWEVRCIADCMNGMYGVEYTIGKDKRYFLSNDPQGLPVDAEDTGETIEITLDTVDLTKTVRIWKIVLPEEGEILFYCELDTHIIYRIAWPDDRGTLVDFNIRQHH